jgi:hypothetical protein
MIPIQNPKYASRTFSKEDIQSRVVPLVPSQVMGILTRHFSKQGYSYTVIAEVISVKTANKDFTIHCMYEYNRQTTKIYIQEGDTHYEFFGYEHALELIDSQHNR